MKKSTVIWIVVISVIAAILLGAIGVGFYMVTVQRTRDLVQNVEARVDQMLNKELGNDWEQGLEEEVNQILQEELGADWQNQLPKEVEEALGKDWQEKLQLELGGQWPKKVTEELKDEFGEEWIDDILGENFLEEILDGDQPAAQTAASGENIRVKAQDVTEIQIKWIAGSIRVEPGKVTAIEFQETESEMPLKYSLQNGQLKILFSEDVKTLMSLKKISTQKDLTITVPEGWAGKKLDIENISSETRISGLNLEKVEYEGVSGDFLLEGCQVDQAEVETVSGDARIESDVRELECETVSGDGTLITHSQPEKLSLNTVSGQMKMELPENIGFTLDFDSLSGKLNCDFPTTKDGSQYTCGSGACQMEIETVSGDAEISKALQK